MPSRAVRLSATTPVNLLEVLGLQPGRTYTLQLQDGESARLYVSDATGAPAPDPATVDVEEPPAGARIDRPIRVEDGVTAEITPGQGPYYYPVWAWDAGEGTLAVLEAV